MELDAVIRMNVTYQKKKCTGVQCLSQDFETGCLELAVVKFSGVQIFKGYHNILIFQPQTCINSSK